MRSVRLSGSTPVRGSEATCLVVLRDRNQPLTITEISSASGLSRPTADSAVRGLMEASLVRETEPSPATGAGRPARAYEFVAEAGRVAGVDIGTTRVRLVIADLAGHEVGSHSVEVPVESATTMRLRLTRTALRRAVVDSGAELNSLRAVTVALPGIIGTDARMTQSLAVPDWVGIDLVGRLSRSWGCPVSVENDIKLAALAEHRVRVEEGKSVDDLAYVHLGHRVAIALIMNGAIVQGRHRLAGELGLRRGMRWTSTSHRGRLRWRTARTGQLVLARARDGDRAARAEIEEFCAELAPNLATLALTVDPAMLVIGGGLARGGETLIAPLRAAVHRLLMTGDKPMITGSRLTSEAALRGAVGAAFETHSRSIFGFDSVPHRWPEQPEPRDTTSAAQAVDQTTTERMIR